MRVYQFPSSLPAAARAVGHVAFHPGGGRLVALAGQLPRRSNEVEPDAAHRVEVGSDGVQTDPVARGAAVSPDGRFAADVSYRPGMLAWVREVRLTRLGGEEEKRFQVIGSEDHVAWLAFSPGGALYAAVSRGAVPGDLLRLGPEAASATVARLDRPFQYGTPPAFAPDGRTLAVGLRAGPTLVVGAADGRVTHEVAWAAPAALPGEMHRLALAPDADRVARVGNGRLACCDPAGGAQVWPPHKALGAATDAAFLPDGTLLAVNREGHAFRLEAATGQVVAAWDWGIRPLLCVAASPDGTMAAAGGGGSRLVVWDLQ